ncbi:MAG TPA: hypothetical protein VKU01_27250 [Bryobacteraceae bacterium]|nr:hypothetical protein [Bryobacteraceae bacterium]
MTGLVALARWEFLIFVGGFCAIVLYRLVSGSVRMSGLLSGDRGDGTSGLSPGRIQLLGATLISALYYLALVIRNPSVTTMPDMPPLLLGVLGASQVAYLGGKAWSLMATSRKSE